jgi:hypothetical protein
MILSMPERSDEDIDKLLRQQLSSAPASWVTRAEELPRLASAAERLEELTADPTDDAMRCALERVGLEPNEERLRALARMLGPRSRR